MKKLFIIVALAFSLGANAALVENAEYSTNLDRVISFNSDFDAGLDWLDFGGIVDSNQTFGLSIDQAVDMYSVDGWRLATNTEVNDLFNMMFPEFVPYVDGYADSNNQTWSAAQYIDHEEWLFHFGEKYEGWVSSNGRYIDEDGLERQIGVGIGGTIFRIYGPDYERPLELGGVNSNIGVMMVRETVVPVPAAVWLFGSGLLGLLFVARRKA